MPEKTPNLGIKKPTGNEVVTRQSFNENWDIIDQNATKKADLDMHLADEVNPHNVTAEQTGAAKQTDFSAHLADTAQHVILEDTFDGDDSGEDYPEGVTLLYVHSNETWPYEYGTVINHKHSNTRFTQFFCSHGYSGITMMWFRHWYSGDDRGWTNWGKVQTDTEVLPKEDNIYDIGSSSLCWNDIYASNSTIQTSDEREKENIKTLESEQSIAFLKALNPVQFKFVDRYRPHYGLISQEVEGVINNLGIDFAGFIKTPVEDIQYDDEGNEVSREIVDYKYGLRYGEFIPLLIKVVQEQQQRIEALENQVNG